MKHDRTKYQIALNPKPPKIVERSASDPTNSQNFATLVIHASWLTRPSTAIAPDLIGCTLVRLLPDGTTWRGFIVETEATHRMILPVIPIVVAPNRSQLGDVWCR